MNRIALTVVALSVVASTVAHAGSRGSREATSSCLAVISTPSPVIEADGSRGQQQITLPDVTWVFDQVSVDPRGTDGGSLLPHQGISCEIFQPEPTRVTPAPGLEVCMAVSVMYDYGQRGRPITHQCLPGRIQAQLEYEGWMCSQASSGFRFEPTEELVEASTNYTVSASSTTSSASTTTSSSRGRSRSSYSFDCGATVPSEDDHHVGR